MKRQQAKVILVEPYFDPRRRTPSPATWAARCSCSAPSVGGVKEATDYITLFDYNINLLTATFKQVLGR